MINALPLLTRASRLSIPSIAETAPLLGLLEFDLHLLEIHFDNQ